MKDPGEEREKAKARVHIPDHSKTKASAGIKRQAENFIQKSMLTNSKAAS